MRRTPLRSFISDKNAVSEEFTSLPALSVVMVGFALFFVLLANVYASYGLRIESVEKYQVADFIATKLTNPDCFFIREGGLVDLLELGNGESDAEINSMRQGYKASNINFIIRISWKEGNEIKSEDFPENLPDYIGDRIAVSRDMGIYLNEAQTSPGKITVILWSTA